jgi:hypothetical protein
MRATKYVASIVAVRYSGKGEEIEHLPIFVEAGDHDEAGEKALEIALQEWPVKEHWQRHSAVALLR